MNKQTHSKKAQMDAWMMYLLAGLILMALVVAATVKMKGGFS